MKHNWITGGWALAAWLVLGSWAAPAPAQVPNQPGNNPSGPFNQGYPNAPFNRYNSTGQWQGYNNSYIPRQDNMGRFGPGQPGYNSGFSSTGSSYSDGFGSGAWQGGNDGNNHRQLYDRGYHDGYQRGYQEAMGRGPANTANTARRGTEFHHVQVSGEIEQVKRVQLLGMEQPLLVGQLMTAAGHSVLVNLGPAQAVDKLNVQPGDTISVHGLLCQRCEPPVLLVEHVRAKGKRTTIEAFEDIEPEHQTITGKLEKLQKVQMPGMRATMLIGLVKDKQGQTVIVDFGSSDQAGELELKEGTQVRVRGDGFECGEHQVLFANRVRANGQTVRLGD